MKENKMSFDKWWDKYKPINKDKDNDEEQIFETYGEDLERILKTPNIYLWTLIDGDYDTQWILPGYHVVNRIGFYVTEKPWKTGSETIDCNEYISTGMAESIVIKYLEENKVAITEDQKYELSDKLKNF